jgi:putative glutamine amidotransferase
VKPIIGISCSLGTTKADRLGEESCTYDYALRSYHRRIEEHGGVPILLPVVQGDETTLRLATSLDGLLLTGGDDMDPACYGEENRCDTSIIHPDRDRFELALLRFARERRLPVLGICRGFQVMNVHFGGSLYQDLSLRPGTGAHKSDESNVYLPHPVRIAEGTRLHSLAGRGVIEVNSRHHQIVNRLAPGLIPAAVAEDGVIEAFESPEEPRFLLGVQWHPERMPEAPSSAAIFREFIRASRENCE